MTKQEKMLNVEERWKTGTGLVPKEILSGMRVEGLIEKWVTWLVYEMERSLYKYYMRDRNIDADCLGAITGLFSHVNQETEYVTKCLEDLIVEEIVGFEDIVIAIYGVASDEVYLVRRFYYLFSKIEEWDTDFMWNNCANDRRLKTILIK